jgi:RNA polymerase sigma-70 factor (ECF subfamily)
MSQVTRDSVVASCPRVAAVKVEVENDYSAMARRYHHRLCAIAFRILHSRNEAEDAVQEAHVHALSHLHQFSGHSALATWLTRIVINEALSRLRRRRVLLTDLDGLHLQSTARDPEEQVVRGQLRERIFAAIWALPPEHRNVFLLREFWDLDTAETAVRLGLTVPCVKTRLHRARALLRKRVKWQLIRGYESPGVQRNIATAINY